MLNSKPKKLAAIAVAVVLLILNVAKFALEDEPVSEASPVVAVVGQHTSQVRADGRQYHYRLAMEPDLASVKTDLFQGRAETTEENRAIPVEAPVLPARTEEVQAKTRLDIELVAVTGRDGKARALIKVGGESIYVVVGSRVQDSYRVARIEKDKIFLEALPGRLEH